MKPFHIRKKQGVWEYHMVDVVPFKQQLQPAPVVSAAGWSDFKALVANWRKNHGFSTGTVDEGQQA